MLTAILHEDDKPVRVFNSKFCISDAFAYARKQYCLDDAEPKLKAWQLPSYLKVTCHMLTEEEFNNLIK